jgi:hypothetical protein
MNNYYLVQSEITKNYYGIQAESACGANTIFCDKFKLFSSPLNFILNGVDIHTVKKYTLNILDYK